VKIIDTTVDNSVDSSKKLLHSSLKWEHQVLYLSALIQVSL